SQLEIGAEIATAPRQKRGLGPSGRGGHGRKRDTSNAIDECRHDSKLGSPLRTGGIEAMPGRETPEPIGRKWISSQVRIKSTQRIVLSADTSHPQGTGVGASASRCCPEVSELASQSFAWRSRTNAICHIPLTFST